MKWLIPVQKYSPVHGSNISIVYAVDCDDPFHAMGEIFYRSYELIRRLLLIIADTMLLLLLELMIWCTRTRK